MAAAFIDWGIPTAESIQMIRRATPDLIIIASGGLRNGIDIAKCIALGAKMGGMAGPFLKAASASLETTIEVIHEIQREIQVCMFACGAADLEQLLETQLIEVD